MNFKVQELHFNKAVTKKYWKAMNYFEKVHLSWKDRKKKWEKISRQINETKGYKSKLSGKGKLKKSH